MTERPTSTELHQSLGDTTVSKKARPLDPLRALAQQHRLRCYRDACGDWNIPGRWGEIFWYGSALDGLPDRIGVPLGGPRANGPPTRTRKKGGNLRINRYRACGGDLEVVQEQLGHASIKTTTIYAKVTKEDKRRAADAMAKAFRDSQRNPDPGPKWPRRRPPTPETQGKGALGS